MKEIIAFLIVSGGLGFFNLYIAQESDLLYFGKYNKEERLAWLSIYSFVNFISIKTASLILENVNKITYSTILIIMLLVISLNVIVTLSLPIVTNKIINQVRAFFKRGPRSYLPPINTFFQDINNYQLYVFDFNGEIINNGLIRQGTEERQRELTVITLPTTPDKDFETYISFMKYLSENKKDLIYQEYTDYDRKYHFIKVKSR